jgi:hypothetical protein
MDCRNWPRIPALRITLNVRGVYLGAEQSPIFAQALRTIAKAVRDPLDPTVRQSVRRSRCNRCSDLGNRHGQLTRREGAAPDGRCAAVYANHPLRSTSQEVNDDRRA